MKNIINSFFIFLFCLVSSQKQSQRTFVDGCYLPSGEKCPKEYYKKNMTYGDFRKNFEKKGRAWDAYVTEDVVTVMFKSFTMTPLCVLVSDDEEYSSDKIKDFINMVNEQNSSYYYYFGNNKFGLKSDLKNFIKEKILDREFLISNLGNPTTIKQSLFGGKQADCLIYEKERLRIYIINDLVVGFDEM